MRHMDRLFGELKRSGATTFEVTEDANTAFLERMIDLNAESVFTVGDCATSRSYYFNPERRGDAAPADDDARRGARSIRIPVERLLFRLIREDLMSKIATVAGLGVAGIGLAHFVKPDLFESVTAMAFPENTDQHLKIDGAAETALGLALLVPKTRKLAIWGVIGYAGYVAANVLKNQTA